MNTTALYVEPLFIGVLFLVALGLPIAPELVRLVPDLGLQQAAPWLAVGTLLAGLAYFAGIFFDRYLDTCLAPLEGHNRLAFARKRKKKQDEQKSAALQDWTDPYPEDSIRAAIMTGGGKAADEFLGYLRTRLRLMRALGFALPMLAFGMAVAMWRLDCPTVRDVVACDPSPFCAAGSWRSSENLVWIGLILPLLLLVQALALGIMRCVDDLGRPPRNAENRFWRFVRSILRHIELRGRWRPADTREQPEWDEYVKLRPEPERSCFRPRWFWGDLVLQPATITALVLFAAAAAIGLCGPAPGRTVAAVAGGLLFAVGAGWAWWRIAGTFMTYLVLFNPQDRPAHPVVGG